MALINHAKEEINAKLVYVGPSSAGKAANLSYIYGKLKESFRGTFKSMNLQDDRMLFFDFLPPGQGNVNGYNVRFHVYTITGDVTHPSTWKMVLKGVDGLVFVADSEPGRMADNVDSLKGVQAALASYGRTVGDVPCVIQCNKRDVPHPLDLHELGRTLNPGNCPQVQAVACRGEGVLESLFPLVKMVTKNLRATGLPLEGEPDQLQRMAAPDAAEQDEAPGGMAAAVFDGVREEPRSAVEEELTVEIAGEAELLGKSGVRLPLSINCGGKVRRLAIEISLAPLRD